MKGAGDPSPDGQMAQLATEIIITLIWIPLRSLQIIEHPMPLEQNCHAEGTGNLCGPATKLGQMSSHGGALFSH